MTRAARLDGFDRLWLPATIQVLRAPDRPTSSRGDARHVGVLGFHGEAVGSQPRQPDGSRRPGRGTRRPALGGTLGRGADARPPSVVQPLICSGAGRRPAVLTGPPAPGPGSHPGLRTYAAKCRRDAQSTCRGATRHQRRSGHVADARVTEVHQTSRLSRLSQLSSKVADHAAAHNLQGDRRRSMRVHAVGRHEVRPTELIWLDPRGAEANAAALSQDRACWAAVHPGSPSTPSAPARVALYVAGRGRRCPTSPTTADLQLGPEDQLRGTPLARVGTLGRPGHGPRRVSPNG